MNIYYIEIKFEIGGNKKVIERANCKSDAITQSLNKLNERDFELVSDVVATPDKGNRHEDDSE